MNLSTRVILVFTVTIAVLFAAETALSAVMIGARMQTHQDQALEDLTRLQEVYARHHVAQVQFLLQSVLKTHGVTTQDWAWWTGSIAAVERPSSPETAVNFSARALEKSGVDLVGVFDLKGRLVLGKQRADAGSRVYGPLDPGIALASGTGSRFWAPESARVTLGFVQARGRLLLLGAQPVRDDLGEGPPRGLVVVGRYFDSGDQTLLGQSMDTVFRLVPEGALDPRVLVTLRTHPDRRFVQLPLGTQFLGSSGPLPPRGAWTRVPAEAGDPLWIEVSVPSDLIVQERNFYQQQQQDEVRAAWITLLAILVSNLILASVYLGMTRRDIRRIEAIQRFADQVVRFPDQPRRLELRGQDELAQIARSIQTMVTLLEDRKKAVEERNTQLQNLNEQLFISHAALRSSFIPMVITDRSGIITKVNPAFLEFYGYSEEEAVGRSTRLFNPGKTEYWNHGIDDDQYRRLFTRMWAQITDPENGRWEGSLFNRTKAGEVVPVQVVISAIQMGPGEILGFIGWTISLTRGHNNERRILIEAFSALSELAEQRDSDTGLHQKRIGLMAAALARRLGMSRKFIHDIEVSAPLHDIGKVGIRDDILLAPRKLSPEEIEVMRRHALIGYEVLIKQPTMQMAAEIALGHHECWDGSGYPHGKTGEQIPLAARIVALVDVYDALRHRRPYKEPWTHQQALGYLAEGRGTLFDPQLVDLFLAHDGEFDTILEIVEDA